jgi:amino acid permease
VSQIFSFFAIVTSFLGIALGCVDFLTDLIYGMLSKESRKEQPAFLTRGALTLQTGCPNSDPGFQYELITRV